ncbi:MAG: orotidine-5'-phosphate decarboxylase [Thiotrichaceae bacterium]
MTTKQLIIALDFPTGEQALSFVKILSPDSCRLKVGFELFVAAGSGFVEKLIDLGFDVFLDLKFHDIPNTVASACRAASRLGVWMMNVHALGGEKMLTEAVNATHSIKNPPILIAVTVLTSMDNQQLSGIGIALPAKDQVMKLADMAKNCGLDGVVCSAQEAAMLSQSFGDEFKLVTPGIRPADSVKGDQSRVMTPGDAIKAGASYLVVGRPITQSNEPLRVIENINQEIMLATS